MSALIVKGGRLLSTGYNHLGDHPAAYFGNSFHAEHDAIRQARCNISGAKMYVYRFARKDDTLQSSAPCVFCQQEIARVGISSVIFIDEHGELKRASYLNSNNKYIQYRHQRVGHTMCYSGVHCEV